MSSKVKTESNKLSRSLGQESLRVGIQIPMNRAHLQPPKFGKLNSKPIIAAFKRITFQQQGEQGCFRSHRSCHKKMPLEGCKDEELKTTLFCPRSVVEKSKQLDDLRPTAGDSAMGTGRV